MNIAGKPVHRGPLVDRPRHVHQRSGRPADVLHFVPITTPWSATPPYLPVISVKLTNRGHVFPVGWRVVTRSKNSQPCDLCGMRKPERGGWDVPCPKAGR
jgi:hypothetical protein